MASVTILPIPVSPQTCRVFFVAELLVTYSKVCVAGISSRVKVPQIQRQGLDIADNVDWDLKPHLNMCA